MTPPQPPTELQPPAPPGAPAGGPPSDGIADAGTRALSEALRSSFVVVRFLMAGMVIVFLGSGLRVVGPQEKAILLRFGRPVGSGDGALLGPGPHWAFPYPIDELVRIPVGEVQTVVSTVGWYGTTPAMEAAGTEPPPGQSLDPAVDGCLLTADENLIHARGTLRYRIREPGLRYAFELAHASNLVANAFASSLLFAASRYTVDEALTRDAAGFRETARVRLDQLIGLQDLGVLVDQIELQAIPPRQLRAPFAAVLEAEVGRGKTINDAKSYANQTVSKANAEAAAIRGNGESERKRLVEFVSAEARRFEELLPAYRRNPRLFQSQHLTDTLGRVLTNAQEKILLPARPSGRPFELRIQVNRQPETLKTKEAAAADHH